MGHPSDRRDAATPTTLSQNTSQSTRYKDMLSSHRPCRCRSGRSVAATSKTEQKNSSSRDLSWTAGEGGPGFRGGLDRSPDRGRMKGGPERAPPRQGPLAAPLVRPEWREWAGPARGWRAPVGRPNKGRRTLEHSRPRP
eukprot:1812068-Pyramimonas_sp.AAC.1